MYIKLFLACALFDWKFASSEKSQSRIVGGKDATKPYPYQVSIERPSIYDGPGGVVYAWDHFCGGSIISNRHVLTAAHCLVDRDGNVTPKEQISALTGTQQLDNGGTRYTVCKTVFHPKYLSTPNNFDIGIITVDKTIKFVPKKVERIPYSKEWTEGGVSCVLTGWGSTGNYSKGPYPNQLQEVQLTTISYESCHEEFDFVTKNNLCTIGGKGQGGCDGDSGGPLVDIKKHVQIGVVTSVSGAGCGVSEPDFYSRTSAFYDWIQQNTEIDDTDCPAGDADDSGNSGTPSESGNAGNSGEPYGSRSPFLAVYNWAKPKKP